MQKIAIFVNSSWNIYNFRMSLLKSLQNDGFEILCIAPKDEYSEKIIQHFKFSPIRLDSKGLNPYKDAILIKSLIKILKREKPDILLNFTIKPNLYGTIASKRCGIPCINNVSGLGSLFIQETFKTRIAKFLYKVTFNDAKKVFFQNKSDLQYFISKKLVKPELTDIVPGSGVDLGRFKPNNQRQISSKTFLMPARLLVDKGVYEYAEAAKNIKSKYPETKFILIGKPDFESGYGIKKTALKSWIKQNLIDYHGFTDKMELFYNNSDCIVLPSYREGTSKALLEALAMGKPIITTDTPGCRETVENDKNGFLCNIKDSKSLENCIEKFILLENHKIFEMGINSRIKAETEFDEKFVIHKYKKAIFDFLGKNADK